MALSSAVLSPVMAYAPDEGLFVGHDQSLGFGFHCRPRPGAGERCEQLLRTLLEDERVPGSFLQIFLMATPNLVVARTRAMTQFASAAAPGPAAMMRRNLDWLFSHAERPFEEFGGLWLREFRLIVTCKAPIEGVVPSEAEIETAAQAARRMERALTAFDVLPERMTAKSFVTLCAEILNRGEHASWRRFGDVDVNESVPLNAQLLDLGSRLSFDEGGVALEGGGHLALLSPRAFGEHAFFGLSAMLAGDLMQGRRGLKGPFWINLTVHYPAAEGLKARLGKKRAWTVNLAGTSMRRWMPSLETRHRDFEALSRAMEDGRRPVRFCLTVGVYGRDREECDRAVTDAVGYWGEYNMILLRDRYIARPLLINCLPLGADAVCSVDLGRYHTMTTQEAACFAPVFGTWRGTGTPTLSFVARDGQVMGFDLFDGSTNFNGVIAAESGAGKSFLMQLMSTSYLAQGAMLWTIDNGGSYQNLCEKLGGEYIDFGHRRLSLNPFRLVRDYAEESTLLQRLVASMAAPTQPLTDLQKAALDETMQAVWADYGRDMTVDLIAQRLKSSKDSRDADLGRQLYAFTTQGSYGHYFAGENTITFSADYTVLELGALKNQPHLQGVVLQQLIYQIQQAMIALSRKRRTIMLIDEAWELLREGEIAKFIEAGYRRFRKEHGAMVIATQSLGDLFGSSVGLAIAENSANKILLGQRPDVIDRLVENGQLALLPGQVDLLKTVRSVRDQYSEAFFITDRGMGVGRIVVDPGTRLLFSSHAPDVAALRRARDAGATLEQAVDVVLTERARLERIAAQ
jgi:conjugal transfer ATP-binding protein TraC